MRWDKYLEVEALRMQTTEGKLFHQFNFSENQISNFERVQNERAKKKEG